MAVTRLVTGATIAWFELLMIMTWCRKKEHV